MIRAVRARFVARETKMILDDPVDGCDRLHPDQGIGRRDRERGVQGRRELFVARHGDEIPQLPRGIGRGGHATRLTAGGAGRIAGRQLRRTDVWIELAE